MTESHEPSAARILSLRDLLETPPATMETTAPLTGEARADLLFLADETELAIQAYEALTSCELRVVEKLAYCKMALGDALAALALLEPVRSNLGEMGKLILVDATLSRHGRRTHTPEARAAMADVWPMLQNILQQPTPPYMAFVLRGEYWPGDYQNRDSRHETFAQGIACYPTSQHLRLLQLVELRCNQTPAAERYAFLASPEPLHPMPRYLWSLGGEALNAGRHDLALRHFRALEASELAIANDEKSSVIVAIRMAIAETLNRQGDHAAALEQATKALDDAPQERQLEASRAFLVVACALGNTQHIELAAEAFVNAMLSERYVSLSSSQVCPEVMFVSGPHWDESDYFPYLPDLSEHRERLLALINPISRGWMRALFAAHDYEAHSNEHEDLPQNWDELATTLGTAAEDTGHACLVLALDTFIRSKRKRPNWTQIGHDWTMAEVGLRQQQRFGSQWDIVESLVTRNKAACTFTLAVTRALKQLGAPAPFAYDAIEALSDHLMEEKLHDVWLNLLRVATANDNRAGPQFDHGLAAQRSRHPEEAIQAYDRVLAIQPGHFAAIYNLLLLCTSPAHATLLAKAASFVETFPPEQADQKKELQEALIAARERCADKVAATKATIRAELASFSPLLTALPNVEDIALRYIAALLALLRVCRAEPDGTVLRPFEGSSLPFSPTRQGRQDIFGLLRSGLVAVSPETPDSTFVIKNGQITGWHLGQVWWRLSPITMPFLQRVRERASCMPWPELWADELLGLAKEIAHEECIQYLNFCADERNWPTPSNQDDLQILVQGLADAVSVSQAFYLCYLGAMAASDHKQRLPVNAQQAADIMIKRTGQRLESVLAGKYAPKSYERPWKLPRSAISLALWVDILGMGDTGFDQRVSSQLFKAL